MSVFFTSDLHLGHTSAAYFREGFNGDIDYHDYLIIDNINSRVSKRDKLFILGDLAFSLEGLQKVKNIYCQNIELILGNHDKYPIQEY